MRISDLDESAAEELKRELPSLKKTDYDTIDNLMKRISRRYKITGKKLHDMFVAKYHHTPDHWIKKYKEKLGENNVEKEVYIVTVDREPVIKLRNKEEAVRIYNELLAEFPNKTVKIEVKKDIGNMYESEMDEDVDRKQNIEQIKDFIKWSYKILHMQKPYPKITLSDDSEQAREGHHTGVHTGDKIWVYIGDRNLVDICRTIFHELVHHRQFQLGMIKDGDSYPGSPIEAMADMMAGKYIKIYGKQNPEIFQ